jgi:hypothetical protein
MDETTQIRLILHNDVTVVSIGEPVNPKLQIVNDMDRAVELRRGFAFNWERLAFVEPNAIHLIAPDGTDLALPYRRDPSYFSGLDPIAIAPNGEEWMFLPIYAHFHLRALGKYRFWIELGDDSGTVHRSNEIGFELHDVESNAPGDAIKLTLQPAKSSYVTKEPVEIGVAFCNKSDKPFAFLKPQEDSFYGWANPIYQFTLLDGSGRSLPLALRSGSMADPRYDESTRIALSPGQLRTQMLRLPEFPDMRTPGTYRVRLTYIVRKQGVGKAGTILDQPMNWDANVFVGRLESNDIEVRIQ